MLKTNFKLALRNLWRNKIFSFINIFGLAFGLACCLMMLVYIGNELSFDKFHKNGAQIFRIEFSNYLNQGGFASTPIPIGPALKEQMPEVKAMTRIDFNDPYLFKYGTNQAFEPVAFADEDVFKIFSFPVTAGDPNTALKESNSIAISERFAKKYFGNEDPLNKLVKIGSTGVLSSTVKAVFKNLPQNSHLQFDCLLSYSTLSKLTSISLWRQMPANYTYIQLNDKADIAKLESKFKDFVQKNAGDELKKNGNPSYELRSQALPSIHFQSHLQGERPGAGNITYVYLLGAIAFMILLIACINFINFTTAHAVNRMKEVGILKVVGALRWQLIKQFLIESFTIYFLAALLALLLSQLLLPLFNEIADRSFVLKDLVSFKTIISVLLIGVVAGLVAGFFPSWSISRLSSIDALKGKVSGSLKRSNISSVLVTAQFAASLILIVASLVVYRQMQFVRREAAYNQKDQVIVFRMNGKLAEKHETIKTELLNNSNISDVSVSTNVPGFAEDGWPIRLTESAPIVQAENYVADDRFLETMGLQLLAGRKLEKNNASDVKEGFLINEAAVHALGFASANSAIDKQLLWGGDERKRGTIIGVVKDFHITSLHEKIAPAVIQFTPYDWMTYNFMLVKIKPHDIANAISFVKKAAASIDGNWLVDYKFFDENFAAIHKRDEQQGKVFSAFALIAVLISALGLLGLTIYAANRRVKEIGIRKVLGATIMTILYLLAKDFIRLILVAAVIAFPFAWWLMNKWLQDFAYRTNINWSVFVLAGLATLLIALVTISFNVIRAAIANPVKSLRSE